MPECTTVLAPSTAAATAVEIEICASMRAPHERADREGPDPAPRLREVPRRDDRGPARPPSEREGGDRADVGGGHVGVDDVDAGAAAAAPPANTSIVPAAGVCGTPASSRPARMRSGSPPMTATSWPVAGLSPGEPQHELLDT